MASRPAGHLADAVQVVEPRRVGRVAPPGEDERVGTRLTPEGEHAHRGVVGEEGMAGRARQVAHQAGGRLQAADERRASRPLTSSRCGSFVS